MDLNDLLLSQVRRINLPASPGRSPLLSSKSDNSTVDSLGSNAALVQLHCSWMCDLASNAQPRYLWQECYEIQGTDFCGALRSSAGSGKI